MKKSLAKKIEDVIQSEGFAKAPKSGSYILRENGLTKIVSLYRQRFRSGYHSDFLLVVDRLESFDPSTPHAAHASLPADMIGDCNRYAIAAFLGSSDRPTDEDLAIGESEFRKALRRFVLTFRSEKEFLNEFRASELRPWLVVHATRIRLTEIANSAD